MDELGFRNALKQFQLQVAQTATAVAQGLSQFRQGMQQAAALIRPMVEVVASIQESIGPFFVELSRALAQLPVRTRESLATLAQHGWYLDPEMTLPGIAEVVAGFAQGQVTEANDELTAYFDQRRETILTTLCTAFPQRATVFTSAFEAHAAGKYELSIPVLLAQADGICLELTGVQLYSKRDGKTRVSEAVATFDVDGFTAALLHPLTEVFPITFSAKERVGRSNILNRHAILHGESVDYGTHINGCKAISLLSFTAWALSNIKKPTNCTVAGSA